MRCSLLKQLPEITNLIIKNVKDMSHLFQGYSFIKTIGISNCIIENITNMNHIFSKCSSLKAIRISKCIVKNVIDFIDLNNIFSGFKVLEELHLLIIY